MFQNRVPHILAGDDTPLSAVNIFVKDLGIVLDQARAHNECVWAVGTLVRRVWVRVVGWLDRGRALLELLQSALLGRHELVHAGGLCGCALWLCSSIRGAGLFWRQCDMDAVAYVGLAGREEAQLEERRRRREAASLGGPARRDGIMEARSEVGGVGGDIGRAGRAALEAGAFSRESIEAAAATRVRAEGLAVVARGRIAVVSLLLVVFAVVVLVAVGVAGFFLRWGRAHEALGGSSRASGRRLQRPVHFTGSLARGLEAGGCSA
jgi:hypothetical protein